MEGVIFASEGWLACVRDHALSGFKCGADSIHGPAHWQRVDDFGVSIAESTGADLTVVRLFALLHDCCRMDDGEDLDHGPRAAEMIGRIVPEVFDLAQGRLDLLRYAVRYHTDGLTTDDATIGTCWDADRLDIGRVGIIPTSRYMSTPSGKEMCGGNVGYKSPWKDALVVHVQAGDIERALRVFRQKWMNSGMVNELRFRRENPSRAARGRDKARRALSRYRRAMAKR
jgi:uncharacterized protein